VREHISNENKSVNRIFSILAEAGPGLHCVLKSHTFPCEYLLATGKKEKNSCKTKKEKYGKTLWIWVTWFSLIFQISCIYESFNVSHNAKLAVTWLIRTRLVMIKKNG